MTAVTAGRVEAGRSSPTATASNRPRRGYASGRDDYLVRLRKIEGQVRGLQRMIEGDRCCPDVVIPVASTTRARQGVAGGLLNDHLHHCGMAAASSSDAEGQ